MLNSRQQAFVENYVKNNNATQAALEAGYAERTAASQGSRLLKNDKVIAEIERRREITEKRTGWDVERLIESFAAIHHRATGQHLQEQIDAGEHVKLSDFVDALDNTAAINSLKEIGKLIGAYTKKVEVEVKQQVPVVVPTAEFPIDIKALPSADRLELLERFGGNVIEGEAVAVSPD